MPQDEVQPMLEGQSAGEVEPKPIATAAAKSPPKDDDAPPRGPRWLEGLLSMIKRYPVTIIGAIMVLGIILFFASIFIFVLGAGVKVAQLSPEQLAEASGTQVEPSRAPTTNPTTGSPPPTSKPAADPRIDQVLAAQARLEKRIIAVEGALRSLGGEEVAIVLAESSEPVRVAEPVVEPVIVEVVEPEPPKPIAVATVAGVEYRLMRAYRSGTNAMLELVIESSKPVHQLQFAAVAEVIDDQGNIYKEARAAYGGGQLGYGGIRVTLTPAIAVKAFVELYNAGTGKTLKIVKLLTVTDGGEGVVEFKEVGVE